MNRNFKVIWNESLNCFTAVAECAKARGKSTQSSVSANASINTTTSQSTIKALRLSAIGLGLLAAGFTLPAAAVGINFTGDAATPIIRLNPLLHETLKIQGGETVLGSSSTKNISVTANSSNKSLTIQLDNDLDLGAAGSLEMGNTLVDSSGIKITANNPNNTVLLSGSGLDNGNNQITNVAVGTDANDAVNVSQLDSTIAANKVKYYSVNAVGGSNELNEGATGQNAMAMGKNAQAIGSQAIAIGSVSGGQNTVAGGAQSIAIGANVVSAGASSIAIGGDDLDLASKSNIDDSNIGSTLNSGTVNTAFNEYAGRDLIDTNDPYSGSTQSGGAASIAIGVKSRSEGALATAVGIQSSAAGVASSAFGIASIASQKGATALGAGANATAENGVALGSKSVADVAGGAGTEGFVPTGISLSDQNDILSTRSGTLGAVSIGNDTDGNRQIVRVAAGTNDSDAVNVAQLKGVSNVVDQGLNFAGDSGTTVNRQLGDTLNITGGETDANNLTTANNIGVIANGDDGLTVQLAKDLTGLNSASFGSDVSISANGLDNGGNKIINVANGDIDDDSTDAINGSQLFETNQNVSNNTTNITTNTDNIAKGIKFNVNGGERTYALGETIGVTTDANLVTTATAAGVNVALGNTIIVGQPTGNPVVIDGTSGTVSGLSNTTFDPDATYTGGQAATQEQLSAANGALTDLGFNISADNGTDDNVDLGSTVNFTNTDGNLVATVRDNEIVYDLADDITVTSATIGDPAGDNTVLTSTADGLDVGGDKITSVGAGDVTAASTDAINGSQLFSVADSVANNFGGGSLVNPDGTVSAPTYTLNNGNNNAGTTDFDNVGDALGNLDTRATTNTAVIARGLNFAGDDGSVVNRQLGDQLNITGGATSNLTTGNIGVTDDGANGLLVQLAETIDLGTAGSVTTGNTLVNNDGLTITGGPSITSTGIDAGNNQITNLASAGDITDVANANNGVNAGDLNAAATGITNTGFNISAQGTNSDNVRLGETVDFRNTDGNLVATRSADNTINYDLADDITVTSATIGDPAGDNTVLTSTANGLDVGGDKITSVGAGDITAASTDAINGSQLFETNQNVSNNTTNITTNTDNIAKGIKFNVNGDLQKTFDLGEEIKFDTDDNLTTTALSTNDGIKLGLADVINIGTDNPIAINGTNGTISGLTNTTFDPNATYTGGQAATQEQLSAANGALTDLGFGIAGANGSPDNIKLGETVAYDSIDGSIITTITDNNVDFALGNNLEVGGPGTNGADGVDGTLGINGADGIAGVSISGQDGNIGLTGADGISGVAINGSNGTIGLTGADGTNGLISVTNGQPGVDGADGITRLVIDDTEVATLQDGLKFAGNTGDTIAKQLNETLSIEGTLADTADATGENLRVDSADGKLNLVMAKNLTGLDSVTIGDTFISTDGLTITGGPSVTTAGIDAGSKVITNVAAGVAPTDAANVSQIIAAAASARTEVAAGTNVANVVKTTGASGQDIYTINANGSATTAGSTAITVTSTTDANNLTTNAIDLSQSTKDSLVKADNSVQYDNADKTSVTLGGTGATAPVTLTNVAEGNIAAGSTDAVNGSQLNDVKIAAAQAKSTVTQGDNIVVTTTSNDDGSTNYEVATSNDLAVNSVTAGDNVLNEDGLAVGDSTLDDNGVTIAGGPNGDVSLGNTGLDNGGNVITNVGAGVADTDAVNVSQLNNVVADANQGFNISAQGGTESNVANGGSVDFSSQDSNITVSKAADSNDISLKLNPNLDLGSQGSVTTGNTIVNNNGVTITGGPSMTASGINAGNQRITDVAAGINETDAVNLGQLSGMNSALNSNITDLGYRVDDVEDDANAGISAAMAMSAIPQSFIPQGKSLIGGGISAYNGEGAVAVGLSRVSDNGRWVLKVNGTADTQGNAGGAIGAGFHF